MDEVRLDLRESLALDNDGVRLVLLRGHEAAEPRALRQLRRGLRGRIDLLGNWKRERDSKLASFTSFTSDELRSRL